MLKCLFLILHSWLKLPDSCEIWAFGTCGSYLYSNCTPIPEICTISDDFVRFNVPKKNPIRCELHRLEPFSLHIAHGTCVSVHIKGALVLSNCSSSCSEWTLPVLHFTILSSSHTLFCPSGAFGSHQPRFSLHTSNLEPRLYLTVCVDLPSIIIASALQRFCVRLQVCSRHVRFRLASIAGMR